MRPLARRPSPLLLSMVAALLAASGCAASGDGDSRDAGNDSPAANSAVPGPAEEPQVDDFGEQNTADGVRLTMSQRRPADDATGRKIIATGNVSLYSEDVEQSAADATAIARRFGGEVTQRRTSTNKHGEVSTAELVLRIPVAHFDTAFTQLQDIATQRSADTGKEDVTTKVIDTQVRLRAQRRSLLRVEALLDRAQSIRDIIRIESQLTRRQADLESLERRSRYLADQTSMSTLTVDISLPPEKPGRKDEKKPEEAGFLAGLEDGWKALKTVGTHLATVTGQALPFAGVLLVVGTPLWLAVRRLRRRYDAPAPAAPADA